MQEAIFYDKNGKPEKYRTKKGKIISWNERSKELKELNPPRVGEKNATKS